METKLKAHVVKSLYEGFAPHDGQKQILRWLFSENVKRILAVNGRNWGKELSLSEEILTTNGWKKFGDVVVGDQIFSDQGEIVNVIGCSPIHYDKPCYRLTFNDHSSIVASGCHPWVTTTKNARKSIKRGGPQGPEKVTTEEILKTLYAGNDEKKGELNHFIAAPKPLQFPVKHLPLHPFILGAWLADGHSSIGYITKPYQELRTHIDGLGYQTKDLSTWEKDGAFKVEGLTAKLKDLGVLGNKNVPQNYLFADEEARFQLLCGMMLDGHCEKTGRCEFYNTNPNLIEAAEFIIRSLGWRCRKFTKRAVLNCKDYGECHTICFYPTRNPFVIEHNKKNWTPERQFVRPQGWFVEKVERIQSVPVRCIATDSPSHLFLIGRQMIPTHNTESALHILARSCLTREALHKDIGPEEVIDSYYVAPNIAHARRIVWDNKRLQQLIPKEFILDVHKNDRMIYLTVNGKDCVGWIKIEGAENIWSLVGVKHKGILCVDETYMLEKAFLDAHEEDLAAYEPPLLLFSTWPIEYPHWIDKLAKEYQNIEGWKFMNRPSMDNVQLEKKNPGYFLKQKARYINRGDENGFRREILSERVIAHGQSIFPNFFCPTYIEAAVQGFQDEDTLIIRNKEAYQEVFAKGPKSKDEHVFPHFMVEQKLAPHKKDLIPVIAVDPGHASRFGTLFMAINPYTKELFFIDEIYEGNRNLISTTTMLALIYAKAKQAFPWASTDEIRKVCDEAALWFRMEAVSISQQPKGPTKGETFSFVPTQKASYKHEYGYSMMKAAMNMQKFFISDKCPWFIWEIINHKSDEKGKIPTKNDHLLDCCRYALAITKYLVTEEDKFADKGQFDDDEFDARSLVADILQIRDEERDPWGNLD